MMAEKARRAILIVLDGVGLEALPDAASYGDLGAATLPHVAQACRGLSLPNLQKLGLGNLADIPGVPKNQHALGGFGRMCELGAGKDSTTGHWELSGVILKQPFATYPNGFPQTLVNQFAEAIGIKPIGNIPASGLSILKKFGPQHLQTGRPILYTSVDSVFQIAAHEEMIPVERLYEICRKARLLADSYRIGRVIARPFMGSEKVGFRRTPRRKDFSMPPPADTILDRLHAHGLPTLGIG
ncbi:MAG: phosphopentomutase, partial [Deltaproteobacteria bacterium]|nr:phosphopentomutase [Deltaproteobacteria bacterium]